MNRVGQPLLGLRLLLLACLLCRRPAEYPVTPAQQCKHTIVQSSALGSYCLVSACCCLAVWADRQLNIQ
jgi:hypothetical protein